MKDKVMEAVNSLENEAYSNRGVDRIKFSDNINTIKQAFINQQSIIDKIEKYVIKWKNSKCVHPDANVLAVEIIQILKEAQNVKN